MLFLQGLKSLVLILLNARIWDYFFNGIIGLLQSYKENLRNKTKLK